ncbi:MAG: hypothetical protein KG028_10395 [Actinobacteria bacterium]|nr:hypothetical protein [Actinomycetota bacterium]
MTVHFKISDCSDDPFDPDSWTFLSGKVEGRWTALSGATVAAARRALQLAEDPNSDVYSVDVTMYLDDGSAGMGVASFHVWHDHGDDRRWRDALEASISDSATQITRA